jgi:hypothetical protein
MPRISLAWVFAMKTVIHCSVLILAMCCTTGVFAANDVEAALQDMQRAIITPQIVIDFCAKTYPDDAENLRSAFDLWHRKHADLIFEIEVRADRLASRAARRDENKSAGETGNDPIVQYRAGYAAKLRSMPETESEPACAKYGTELVNGGVNVSDLEKMFAAQLKLIRSKDAAPDFR